MKRIDFLVFRHGETDWNRDRRLQGHSDIPLNETGREQARSLARRVHELKPEIIVTSDLIRARETADIVNRGLERPVFETSALRECGLGEVEGLTRDELLNHHEGPNLWARWWSDHDDDRDFAFPGGESKRVHLNRILSELRVLPSRHPAVTRIAVSTHGGSLMRLVQHCVDAPEEIALPNCVLYRISWGEGDDWRFHGLA